MSTKIGRFEIVSEITKSACGAVYKATDPDAGRTVALKTIRLSLPPDLARILIQLILQEAETTKVLNSQNIAQIYGAGEIDGQVCAAMEYVEGNSLANMIARQEGFSIWDLLDISRQVCLALDHADSHGVLHKSLEPAKIMVQWDGTVKVLGYGVSTMVSAMPQKSANVPPLFYYMSPEQVKGELMDVRSNIFTWGAILYEMVTDRKPFTGDDVQTVRQKILEETPEPPATVNPRVNLSVSRVIMQALAKSPDERYTHGHELLVDLEKAKETSQAKTAKAAQSPSGLINPAKTKAAADGPKFIVPTPPDEDDGYTPLKTGKTKTVAAAPKPAPAARNAFASAPAPQPRQDDKPEMQDPLAQQPKPPSKAMAAAASAGGPASVRLSSSAPAAEKMSAAEPPVKPAGFKTDPMMSGGAASGKASSFSEIDELPPLKPDFQPAPEPPPAPVIEIADHPAPAFSLTPRVVREDKPRVVTRENARKAVTEIKQVPARLLGYAIGAAVVIMLGVVLWITFSIRRQSDDDTTAQPVTAAQPVASPQPAPAPVPAASDPAPAVEPEPEASPEVSVTPRYAPKPRRAAPAPKPVIIPGQLTVESSPAGAQLQIDGKQDPAWMTPYNLAGLAPGSHTITVSKPGFVAETRSIQISAGSKSFVSVHLAVLGVTLSVTSQPAGANIYLDGRDTGHVTPAQITADKGSHTILVRKEGYLDEITTNTFSAGQKFDYSPVLKLMGVTDDIKTGGKFKRLFGGGDSTAGMGKVTIKTQPKGAQVTVNRRMVDKPAPVDFMLNPGNYMIDITLSGYQPVHRVVNVEKGSKIELNESLQPE